MSRREKICWIIAYLGTAILTLLPFFQVGFTTSDDFQYYNTARQNFDYWLIDAEAYAKTAGRFYFLITKYFYYVPYLIDSFIWTKFVQYSMLAICFLLFTYLIYRIFKSQRLAALTLLLLIFNLGIGYGYLYFPAAYPFYFTFSLSIFLTGILLFLNYVEKGGYGRVIASAVIFFISFLFYENYLVYSVFFCAYILIRNWHICGFKNLWAYKQFYKELLPVVCVMLVYMACYIGYRQYLIRTLDDFIFYGGTTLSGNFSLANFFHIIYKCTIYNLPGEVYYYDKYLVDENSLLWAGHHDVVLFILTHASVISYINALIQCAILWYLMKKMESGTIKWSYIIWGIVVALFVANMSHFLIAITNKYNGQWADWIRAYVTSFYSYFGIMLVIALGIVATLKLCKRNSLKYAVSIFWCCIIFCFSIVNTYTNEHISREWQKSQHRVDVINMIGKKGFFECLPKNAVIYTEQLHKTSDLGFSICESNKDFEDLITYHSTYFQTFAFDTATLCKAVEKQSVPLIYFIQATETKKAGELMVVLSHISHFNAACPTASVADSAEIFYYSPTKDFTLYERLYSKTDSAQVKMYSIFSCNKHKELSHIHLAHEGIDPLNFSISNMITYGNETIWIP